MAVYYEYRLRSGTFRIIQDRAGWQAFFGDEHFDGPYPTAQGLAEDIANGHTAWPSCGDPSQLGVPEDLSDWQPMRS